MINQFKLVLCMLAGVVSVVSADSPNFAVVGVEKQRTSISNTSFGNYSFTLLGGRWLQPGIGVQAGLVLPAQDDTVGSVDFSLDGLYSAGIRLESPLKSQRDTAAFVSLGLASAKISASSAFDQTSDWYHGYFATAGVIVGLSRSSQLTLEYSHNAVDSEVEISAFKLGYRFQF